MAFAAALLALIPPVAAAPGDGVGELAQVLGHAHGLHRLCAGPTDNLWRGRMERLLLVEHATPAQRTVWVARFNAGFAAAGAEHAGCDAATRAALAETTAQGADLAAAEGRRAAPSDTPAPSLRGRAP